MSNALYVISYQLRVNLQRKIFQNLKNFISQFKRCPITEYWDSSNYICGKKKFKWIRHPILKNDSLLTISFFFIYCLNQKFKNKITPLVLHLHAQILVLHALQMTCAWTFFIIGILQQYRYPSSFAFQADVGN